MRSEKKRREGLRSRGGSRVLVAEGLRAAKVEGEEVEPGGADLGGGRPKGDGLEAVLMKGEVDERLPSVEPNVVVGRRGDAGVAYCASEGPPLPPLSARAVPVSKRVGVEAEAPASVVGLLPPRTLIALLDPRRVRPRAHLAFGLRTLPSAAARPVPPLPCACRTEGAGEETERDGEGARGW